MLSGAALALLLDVSGPFSAWGVETSTSAPAELPPIIITGRPDAAAGADEAASEGEIRGARIQERPILRQGDVLEVVPGVVITQHSGPGKANQYFLRGFNLDHGTDFATNLDGMPLNLPSHAHGQGYTDLNFIMPELIRSITYTKGPYFADRGDFASAGSADIRYADTLQRRLTVEGGADGYGRALLAGSTETGRGRLLYGLEASREDGPWTHPDGYRKLNGVLRWSDGSDAEGVSLMATGYHGEWNATDQIAARAVEEGLISRFDSLDSSDGGDSQRYALQGEWHRDDGTVRDKVAAYGSYYDLDLFSNFTYFLEDPVHGDQMEQKDRRWIGGLSGAREWTHRALGLEMTETAGVQVRDDSISNGLYHTEDRVRLATTRADDINELSVAPYVENRTRWSEKLRTVLGLRADDYRFDVRSDNPVNSGVRSETVLSPKASLVIGPWGGTEVYLDGGFCFHSNDARGVTAAADPKTGLPVSPATPLARSRGGEVGVRTAGGKGARATLALWLLDSDSELVFDGDQGTTDISRPSRRYGAELSGALDPAPWLSLDADVALSHARFTQDDPVGNHIPDSMATMASAGVSVHGLDGWFGEARLRYFGPRPLIEDDSVRSSPSTMASLRAGRTFAGGRLTAALEVFNLFNDSANDIEYYYASRLAGEPPSADGTADIHFHPAEPRELRASLTARF